MPLDSNAPKKAEKEMVTFRIRKNLKDKLTELAKVTGRSQTYLTEAALEAYCDLQMWQVAAVAEGIKAAESGEVSSHETVKRYWESKLENSLD
ncbi:MAG: ribbon-helix-helix protein, CopG family [Vampirovibrionales bacterium]|nr:ribbon-helix-helix protein, CopG family [Vampirovibrionales bacterium]